MKTRIILFTLLLAVLLSGCVIVDPVFGGPGASWMVIETDGEGMSALATQHAGKRQLDIQYGTPSPGSVLEILGGTK